MGTDTTPDLYIPDEAIRIGIELMLDDYEHDDEIAADVRKIAIPVVAAELRRLAKLDDGVEPRAYRLSARANELDGGDRVTHSSRDRAIETAYNALLAWDNMGHLGVTEVAEAMDLLRAALAKDLNIKNGESE